MGGPARASLRDPRHAPAPPRRPAAARRGVLSGVLALALAGCATMPEGTPPVFAFRAAFDGAPRAAPVLLENAEWWRGLGDPVLDALVAEALAGSLDLARARARLDEARATLEGLAPPARLTAEARAGGRRDSAGGGTRQVAEADLGFGWLFDIHGQRRAETAAARARLEAADAEVDAARLLVLLRLGETYVDLRHAQNLREARRGELAARNRTLDLVRRMQESEAATRLELLRAETQVAETRAGLPELEAEITAARAALAVLAGRAPGGAAPDLDRIVRQPRPRLAPEVGIPADLLRNRPDIRVAEQRYHAALADLGAARAAAYPRLSLSGTISLFAGAGGSGARAFLGPALRLPDLPDNEPRARAARAEAAVRGAHAAWEQTVLEAIRDVETGLARYAAAHRALGEAERALRLNEEIMRLTRETVAAGTGTLRELIDAEERAATARGRHAEALRRLGRAYVGLHVTLGAGHAVSAPTAAR